MRPAGNYHPPGHAYPGTHPGAQLMRGLPRRQLLRGEGPRKCAFAPPPAAAPEGERPYAYAPNIIIIIKNYNNNIIIK